MANCIQLKRVPAGGFEDLPGDTGHLLLAFVLHLKQNDAAYFAVRKSVNALRGACEARRRLLGAYHEVGGMTAQTCHACAQFAHVHVRAVNGDLRYQDVQLTDGTGKKIEKLFFTRDTHYLER